jgi:hypothetical protein
VVGRWCNDVVKSASSATSDKNVMGKTGGSKARGEEEGRGRRS